MRALTNASGSVTDSFRYDAFGNALSHQGTMSSSYGYGSQHFDSATGLYQLRARSYDPTSGRFLSRDPAISNTNDPAQLDRYIYAASPIMLSDPSGLKRLAASSTVTWDPAGRSEPNLRQSLSRRQRRAAAASRLPKDGREQNRQSLAVVWIGQTTLMSTVQAKFGSYCQTLPVIT